MEVTRILRFLLDLTLYALFGGALLVLVAALYLLPSLPDARRIEDVRLQEPLRIYSADQRLIGEFGKERRQPTGLEKLPDLYIKAVLAAEDDRFFRHPGVDLKGLLRATLNALTTGRITQGGSTITMQLARNLFLSPEKTLRRKFAEIILALKIEREFSKNRIMELYVNKIYFGNRAYGINAAAEIYYGRHPTELNLAQMAMLAGIPQLPSVNNPVHNIQRAERRRKYVLNRMLTLEYIDQQQYQDAIAFKDTAGLHGREPVVEASYVAEMVRREMLQLYPDDTLINGYRVYTTVRDLHQEASHQALQKNLLDYTVRHGYRGPEQHHLLAPGSGPEQWEQLLAAEQVYGGLYPALVLQVHRHSADIYLSGIGRITLPWKALAWARPYISQNRQGPPPQSAPDILSTGDLIRIREDLQGGWQLMQLPRVQGCLVALDPADGAILALAGGFDFRLSHFNRVTQAQRQPGSGFKPFLFSAALEFGYTAATLLNDAPEVYPGLGKNGSDWRPRNYSGKHYGPTRLREALVHSRNLAAVKLLEGVGLPSTRSYMRRFGFDPDRLPDNLSMALGSGEVTPLQLARAYAVFANGGYLVTPYLLARVEDRNGKVLYTASPTRACTQGKCPSAATGATIGSSPAGKQPSGMAPHSISAQNAWLINSFTRDVIQRGTGRRARSLGRRDLSGKTGTTNDQRDAWFSGYNHQLIAVSWTGFDDSRPLGHRETGARAALPAWIVFMEKTLHNTPESTQPRPSGLINAYIDPDTGRPSSSSSGTEIVSEVFRTRYAPVETDTGSPGSGHTDDINKQLF